MNSYSAHLQKAVVEFQSYALSEKGKVWPADWFLEMQRLLAIAADEKKDRDAERLMNAISYSITDSGPLDGSLSPSFSFAQAVSQKKNRKLNADL